MICLVAYVLPLYATDAAGMICLSCLYKNGKHVVADSLVEQSMVCQRLR